MASMVWIAQGGIDVEAPLVLTVVASSVDGGLGSSTQRALTWKSDLDLRQFAVYFC